MAPSAEHQSFVTSTKPSYTKKSSPRSSWHNRAKTVACAVNYEPSMVEDFHSPSSTKLVGLVENPTYEHTTHTRSNSFVENVTPNTPMQRRTSKRESKQRSVSLNPISVRYEMELVPRIQKNLNFYPSFNTKRSASFNSPKSGEEAPFFESVLWKPSKRKDWEDCLSELVAVCTSAGLRQYIALHTGKRGKKPQFVPPLSREYIRDRIDIDDPLRGVQVRHATQGWLQGFLLWTNFTTWTHYFTWDSRHELAGVQKCQHAKKDADGTLAEELQALPRTGSPLDAGVIFESVAEIALLGGLGCGELLLRMALEEIIQSGQYQYVVLQATVGSRTFYERFGFQRVGAVCRYGDQGMLPTLETPVQGYRHWTHANECQKSLDMHGGPSYMMVLKLADYTENMPKLLQVLDHYCVQDRPRIAATPMALTPKALKKLKRPSSGYTTPELPNLTPTTKRVFATTANMQPATLPAAKRPRTFDTMTSHTPMPTTTHFMTTPPAKTTLSYAEKQYQSVWLAVPPTAASTTGVLTSKQQRKPPRSRSVKNNSDTKKKKKQKSEVKLLPNPSPLQKQVVPSDKIQSVDRATLCKQKVKSYPRDRLHYYNKIVTAAVSSAKKQYYFVLHYNEPKKLVTLCPMAVKGILSGRRQGRPRFQCVLQETSANWISGAAKDYTPVEAFMVMKTPIVAQEAWDVLGA